MNLVEYIGELTPLTAQQVAEALGLTTDTVKNLKRDGKLRSVRIGRADMYLAKHVREYLASLDEDPNNAKKKK